MKTFKDLIIPRARDEPTNVIKGCFDVKKTDNEQHLVFGWANVTVDTDGKQVEDWQEDIIDTEELEKAAYLYVEWYREGGEKHERGRTAIMIESMMFTKEKMPLLGLQEDALPEGWWIGFKVLDMDVWEKVKDGTYKMFSIEGSADREEVET